MRGGTADGPAVLMLHGSGSNGAVWIGAGMELGTIARTYALDIPGEPGNSAAVRCGWVEMVDWLGDVRRQIPERPLVLLGNSLGGWLAMASAVADPADVAAVMTICPAGICPRRSSYKWYALAARWAGEKGPRVMEKANLRGQKMDDEFREFFDLAGRHFIYRPSVPMLSDDELRQSENAVRLLGREKGHPVAHEKDRPPFASFRSPRRHLHRHEWRARLPPARFRPARMAGSGAFLIISADFSYYRSQKVVMLAGLLIERTAWLKNRRFSACAERG